jgi:RNA polymerase sigma-70 factor (ECF subfamily)
MSEGPPFEELIQRVRAGDGDAAADLVRRYEPAIRRAVRFRLDTRLRSVLDSMDICQSVLASFFVRASSGQYELTDPGQLLRLLVAMARNKIASQARRQEAQRRDRRRVLTQPFDEQRWSAAGTSPSGQVEARELLLEVRRRLSPEERRLVELRHESHDWDAIATEVGGTPEALRKRLARALDRVAQELGLDGEP